MDQNFNRFQERLGRINRASSGQGETRTHMRSDGLIVESRPRRRLSIPWRSVMLAVICCLMLKGFLIWHQGEEDFAARLVVLEEDGTGGQIAAGLLSMDPASLWISQQMGILFGPPPE